MGLKNIVEKLAKPIVISAGILAGALYPADTAKAQSPGELRAYGDAFRSFGRIQRSGLLPANSIDDLKFQQGMGIFMDFMSDTAYSSAQSKDFETLRQTIRNSPEMQKKYLQVKQIDVNQIPQTYIANYRKDFNGDKGIGIEEYIGLNKNTFNSDEKLIFGVYLPIKNIKGKEYDMRVSDPKGNLIFRDKNSIKKDYFSSGGSLNLDVLLERFGEGTYSIAYYLDEKHWENREFNLRRGIANNGNDPSANPSQNLPETFLTHWIDLNKNGQTDSREELTRDKRQRFIEGERISFVNQATKLNANETYEVKIFEKTSDKLIETIRDENSTEGKIFHRNNFEPGKYYAIFKLDGKYRNDISFEVLQDKDKKQEYEKFKFTIKVPGITPEDIKEANEKYNSGKKDNGPPVGFSPAEKPKN
jgi:hypothetical protein